MPLRITGNITNQTMARAMPLLMASARHTGEQIFNMTGMVEHHRMMMAAGETWVEPQFNNIEAQYINDNEEWENPQLVEPFRDLRIDPVAWGVQILLNDNVRQYMQAKVWAQSLGAGERAMRRFEDKFIIQGFNAAQNIRTGAGQLDQTKIRVERSNLMLQADSSNKILDHAEPPPGMIKLVCNEFQLDDLEGTVSGNYNMAAFGQMSEGLTARTFEQGLPRNADYVGRFAGVDVHRNNHLVIKNNLANALMFSRASGVYVSHSIRMYEVIRKGLWGEGAELMVRRHKAGFGLRRPDIWTRILQADATRPT